jgi:proline dehydrogenase
LPSEHNIIRGFVFRLVRNRIAGSTLSSVLKEARENDSRGIRTTITFLNNNVDDAAKARYNANAYAQLAKQSSRLNLKTDISVRLTQLGMGINHGVLDACLSDLLKALKDTGTRIWFEEEEGADTNELMEIYRKYREEYDNIGIEMPAMYNLEVGTIKRFLKPNDLVKLTYYPSEEQARANENGDASEETKAKKKDRAGKNGKAKAKSKGGKKGEPSRKHILERYIANIGKLLQADVGISVLDRDEKLISKIAGFSKEYKKNLIFELPLGYSERKLNRLAKMKMNLSIYAPYGKDWTSFVVNRLTAGHGRIRKLAERVLESESE